MPPPTTPLSSRKAWRRGIGLAIIRDISSIILLLLLTTAPVRSRETSPHKHTQSSAFVRACQVAIVVLARKHIANLSKRYTTTAECFTASHGRAPI